MALAYLLDPQLQYSDKSGALNVAGFLRVYLNGTDDRAVTYSDFAGTLNQADIVLDNNGRAVVIADSSRAYRLEVYNREGALLWTQYPINTIVGGAGGTDGIVVESTDGSIQVDKYNAGGLVHFDLSTEGAQELEWTRTDSYLLEESAEGVFLLPVNQVEGNMAVDGTGILLNANVHYDVSMYINIEAPSTVVNRFDGLQFRVGGPDAPVAAVTFDNSYAHRQVACLSCDVHPQADTRLRVYVEGLANGAVLSCSQCTVHSLAATYTTGSEYVAGDGINIESNVISVDPTVVQHTLVPGQNITIENNVISAAGGGATYTAGSGISIDQSNVISADYNAVQAKLTAGTGITISGNTISATGGGGFPGDILVLPNINSGSNVPGWSWTEFQARIDADVADGRPIMLVRQSTGNHPAGETAFYYHAVQDHSITGSWGAWIYEFGTVAAQGMNEAAINKPAQAYTSHHVTYKFYQDGDTDNVRVLIGESALLPCPHMSYDEEVDYSGRVLGVTAGNAGFAWLDIHQNVPIQVTYRYDYPDPVWTLYEDPSEIWLGVLNALKYGTNPELILVRNRWGAPPYGKHRLQYTYNGVVGSGSDLSQLTGSVQFFNQVYNSSTDGFTAYSCVLEKASAGATPTLTWRYLNESGTPRTVDFGNM